MTGRKMGGSVGVFFVVWIILTGACGGVYSGNVYGLDTALPAKRGEEGLVRPRVVERVITVGGPEADIGGYSSAAIQIAVDALKARGGGTVKLGAGTFEMTAGVRLASGISLVGAGKSTKLVKVDGFKSALGSDCGYGKLRMAVEDASGFKVGMGVIIQDSANNSGWAVTTARITAIEGDMLYIDDYTVRDYQSGLEGVVSNACSLIEAVECEDVRIADLFVDGNRGTNDYLGGCRGGGIYLRKSRRCVVEGVKVTNFNGDGISWQITEDMTVRNCEVQGCSNFGFHPGTGSVRTRMQGCISHDNGTDGIFICWRVQDGVFRNNSSYRNGRHGLSIGHKDTGNVLEGNRIYENGVHGIYMRDEAEQNGAHRNKFLNNVIENNGTKEGGYGVYIDGVTHDIVIKGNTIRDTGPGYQKSGIYIGQDTSNINVRENRMSGHKEGDIIEESKK